MTIRSFLLAGAVFPFAAASPVFALDSTSLAPGGLLLAQNTEIVCADGSVPAEGEECPAVDGLPTPPAGAPALPEGAPTLPDGAPALPEGAPTPPQGAPSLPEGAPTPPAGAPAVPEAAAPAPDGAAAPAEPEAAAPQEAPSAPEQPAEPMQAAPEAPSAGTQAAPQAPSAATPEAPAADLPPTVEDVLRRARQLQEQQQGGGTQQNQPAETPAEPPAVPSLDQPAAAQPQAPSAEPPTPEDVLRRARRQQQRLQEQGQGAAPPAPGQQAAPEQPTAPAAPQQPAGVPAPQDPATAGAPPPPPSIVEQQLEAQGDQEAADQIRELQEKLRQAQEAIAPPPPVPGGEASDGRRDRERAGRRDRVRGPGRGEVVENRGDRVIIDLGGGNIFVEPVVPDEGERLLYGAEDVEVIELPGGRTQTTVFRENGSQIVTIRNRRGDIIRRVRVTRNGREVVLIDNRLPENPQLPPPPVIVENLPPLVIDIPEEQYIVDLGEASEADIEGALLAPPVQQVERAYTLEEVTRNERVRAYVPRIDLDTITFDFGSATIGNSQMDALVFLGQAMEEVLAENPDEVYLIEGHTDAVGSDYDNLILSDRRAEAVAVALSQNFDIPPENLITEGYGEQYLKIETEAPSRENRRVSVRRITELLQAENQ